MLKLTDRLCPDCDRSDLKQNEGIKERELCGAKKAA